MTAVQAAPLHQRRASPRPLPLLPNVGGCCMPPGRAPSPALRRSARRAKAAACRSAALTAALSAPLPAEPPGRFDPRPASNFAASAVPGARPRDTAPRSPGRSRAPLRLRLRLRLRLWLRLRRLSEARPRSLALCGAPDCRLRQRTQAVPRSRQPRCVDGAARHRRCTAARHRNRRRPWDAALRRRAHARGAPVAAAALAVPLPAVALRRVRVVALPLGAAREEVANLGAAPDGRQDEWPRGCLVHALRAAGRRATTGS